MGEEEGTEREREREKTPRMKPEKEIKNDDVAVETLQKVTACSAGGPWREGCAAGSGSADNRSD